VRFWERDGKPFYESSGSKKESDARQLLKLREGDVARGVPITPKTHRIRFSDLAQNVINDYRVNGRKSIRDLERRFEKYLLPSFGRWLASSITTADIRRFTRERLRDGATNAEVNRELAALKRAFSLAQKDGKLMSRTHIPMLKENNVRKGFFERDQFERVRELLPSYIKPIVLFAFITGWRIRSEILTLQWRQVDFQAGRVRLDPGTTKNDEGRIFPFTNELRQLLEEQREKTVEFQNEKGVVIPWVFHRDGHQIMSFYKAWRTACRKAGIPGKIPHDFRRTAVRNLVRAGVPERVAMQMTGHKTRSVFERYNIVSEADLKAAAERLDLVADGQ
jgi:integrase